MRLSHITRKKELSADALKDAELDISSLSTNTSMTVSEWKNATNNLLIGNREKFLAWVVLMIVTAVIGFLLLKTFKTTKRLYRTAMTLIFCSSEC